MTRIIGITGPMGAGKDALAEALVRGHGFSRRANADTLKQVLALIASEPVENFHDRHLKEALSPALGMTRRLAMQLLGTEVARKLFGESVWSDALINKWITDGMPDIVVSDVRFDNEASAILAEGGVIVRVTRPGYEVAAATATGFWKRVWDFLTAQPQGHVSEAGVSGSLITFVVYNDGPLEELDEIAKELMDSIRALEETGSAG